jgi:hypothetical protein
MYSFFADPSPPSTPPASMFEARLIQGNLLKKIVEAIKDLVTEANVDCSETGLSMQVRRACHAAVSRRAPTW